MSYYTYFKLKKDSYYDKMTVDEIKSRLKNTSSNIYTKGDKSILKANMVRWYYNNEDDLSKRRMSIINLLIGIQCNAVKDIEYNLALECKEKESGICRNRPISKYDMQEYVDNWYNNLDKTIGNLLVLSCIKFETDEYVDTSKKTSEYLRYEYQNEINEILDLFEEEAIDYEFYKFCVNNCVRRTEDEEEFSDD